MELRASKAGIWANCAASKFLPEMPEGDREAAEEGTRAHEVAAALLQGRPVPEGADPEMVAHAEGYLEFCQDLSTGGWWVELPLEGRPLPGVTGTCDAASCHDGHLVVVDYKYGRGDVPAKDNRQLQTYAVLLSDTMGLWPSLRSVTLAIYQPRSLGKREKVETYTGQSVANWAVQLSYAAETQEPQAKTGPHCRYCRSRPYCSAFLDQAGATLEVAALATAVDWTAQTLGPAIEYLRRAEAVAKAAREAIEQLATERINSGQPVAGWTLDRGPGKRQWSAPLAEIKAAGRLLGIDLVRESPVGITEAFRHKGAAALLDTLVTRSEGQLQLQPFEPKGFHE